MNRKKSIVPFADAAKNQPSVVEGANKKLNDLMSFKNETRLRA